MSLYALAAHPSVWAKCPWVAASPIFVSFLLLFVSGEPLVESCKVSPVHACCGKHGHHWLQGCPHWRRVTASGTPREMMRLDGPSESTRQRPTCWFQGPRRLFKHCRSDHRYGKASLQTRLLCRTLFYRLPERLSRPCEHLYCTALGGICMKSMLWVQKQPRYLSNSHLPNPKSPDGLNCIALHHVSQASSS